MSIDQIIANSQQTISASLREAFNAGRAEAAVELRERVHALVEELIGAYTLHTSQPAAAPAPAHVEAVAPAAHEHADIATTLQPAGHAEPAPVDSQHHDQGQAPLHDQGQVPFHDQGQAPFHDQNQPPAHEQAHEQPPVHDQGQQPAHGQDQWNQGQQHDQWNQGQQHNQWNQGHQG